MENLGHLANQITMLLMSANREEPIPMKHVQDVLGLINQFFNASYIFLSLDIPEYDIKIKEALGIPLELFETVFTTLLKFLNDQYKVYYEQTQTLSIPKLLPSSFYQVPNDEFIIHNVKGILSAPIILGIKQVGQITLIAKTPGAFLNDNPSLLSSLGSLIASALVNNKKILQLSKLLRSYLELEHVIAESWVIIDKGYNIKQINNAGLKMFGSKVVNTSIFDYISSNARLELVHAIDKVRELHSIQRVMVSMYFNLQEQLADIMITEIKFEEEEEPYILLSIRKAAFIEQKSDDTEDKGKLSYLTAVLDKPYVSIRDLDKLIPLSVVITFNERMGPVLIESEPKIKDAGEQPKTMTAVIKLASSIDFEDVSNHSFVLGSFPWMDPTGTMHFIAFVLENDRARGGKELHIIGINLIREIDELTMDLKGIINGHLHNAMNEYGELIYHDQVDFATKPFMPQSYASTRGLIRKVLQKLRKNMLRSLCEWYNIPLVESDNAIEHIS